jgi:hypothetical protein
MSKQDKKHIGTFRQDKLMPEETIEAQLDGWLDKPSGQGGVIRHNGQFVLTNKQACFYSKAPFEEIFETIPLSKITSVETSSLMGYRVLRLHTAHDDLEFKTLSPKLSSTSSLRTSNAFVTSRPAALLLRLRQLNLLLTKSRNSVSFGMLDS